MPLRILPIASPSEQDSLDNVLSEEVLTTLRKSLADKESYLLEFQDKKEQGCFVRAVLKGYYVEGTLTTDELADSYNDDIYLYLNIDTTTNQLIEDNPWSVRDSKTDDTLHVATCYSLDRGWEVIEDSYHRILPRALDLSQTLVLRCGTATTVKNLS